MKITKPMLAAREAPDLSKVEFPVLATPKLDGIRCLVDEGTAKSRAFKRIQNDYTRIAIETAVQGGMLFDGIDGELLVAGMGFNDLSGALRRKEGEPNFYYAVFDYVSPTKSDTTYLHRMLMLEELVLPEFCRKLLPKTINSIEELSAYEAECLAQGYEGLIIRSPASPYKCGRSTLKEGYMLKIKQFEDSEAYILMGMEMMHNDNEATKDNFGRTERSSHKENMRPAGVLGKLILKPMELGPIDEDDIEWRDDNIDRMDAAVRDHPYFFGCGTGFDAETRADMWAHRSELQGKIVKYKHQPHGAKCKPRIPVFCGIREMWDL